MTTVQGDHPPLPSYQRQTRHIEIKRLLIALEVAEEVGGVLQGRSLDASIPSANKPREGHSTAWARRLHRNSLRQVDQLAANIQNRLDPQYDEPSLKCQGGPNPCGKYLNPDSRFCRHCGNPTKVESDT